MDRYVLVISFLTLKLSPYLSDFHVSLFISLPNSSPSLHVLPACSLSGSPSTQRWHFAVQAIQEVTQFCSSDWEELRTGHHKTDSEEETPSAIESCLSFLSKALLDVLVLGSAEQSPPIKDLLPLLGALKHMSCWHAANITVVTEHTTGWQNTASYLSAGLMAPSDLDVCISHQELWRGSLVIREKKVIVFHYYASDFELVQLVDLSDLPAFLISTTQFELYLHFRSLTKTLSNTTYNVGALFSLSCIITPVAQPAASQLSSQRWRESIARRPKSFPVPDVEVKGESAHYFLLVQGSDDIASGACRVTMLHSDIQINGAAAMATVSGLLREKSLSPSVQREVKMLPHLAREQYLKMIDAKLPSAATCLTDKQERLQSVSNLQADWPERSVLHNIENLQRRRQKRRLGLLGPGSSDSLLGPKDGQKVSSTLLDARELLKHFTCDGLPTGELQPLAVNRGNNVFQLSPDLSPGRVSQMPFNTVSASHYHGIEFCLDNQRSLDRDQAFMKLQSRLIRYETQTTCSKEPCALPFALSPAPSPAVMSEPGSVPDGETLQNADVARLKHVDGLTVHVCAYLCFSGSSGTHPAVRSLRQQPSRSQSTSSTMSPSSSSATRRTPSGKTRTMLLEVVAKTLKHHGITGEHKCFEACSKRLFDISKFYLKDLKTSRGLNDEMKKAASINVKQVINWVLEKSSKK
uniref:MDM2 binding protein n=1 Tax=Labrus bergylta TaxID=56723 RepID=A0A3Q3GI84_9LABR